MRSHLRAREEAATQGEKVKCAQKGRGGEGGIGGGMGGTRPLTSPDDYNLLAGIKCASAATAATASVSAVAGRHVSFKENCRMRSLPSWGAKR